MKKPAESADEAEKAKSVFDLIEEKVLAIANETVKGDEFIKKKKEILTELCKVTGKKPPADEEEKKKEEDDLKKKEEEEKKPEDVVREQEEESKGETADTEEAKTAQEETKAEPS